MSKTSLLAPSGMPPAFSEGNVPIFLTVSNEYFKYFLVLLCSIMKQASQKRNYDLIVIIDCELDAVNLEKLKYTLRDSKNVSVRFFDVRELVSGWNPYLRASYRINTYYRLLAPYFMSQFDKAIYLDVDTIVLKDLACLFDIDLGTDFLGVTRDVAAQGYYLKGARKDLVADFNNNVCIDDIKNYFQAAVMSVNLKQFRDEFTIQSIKSICTQKNWMYVDQDVYNYIAKGRVLFLDLKWDVTAKTVVGEGINCASAENLEEYNNARKNPYIIHYPGERKPWLFPETDLAFLFWNNARDCAFYEQLLKECISSASNSQTQQPVNKHAQLPPAKKSGNTNKENASVAVRKPMATDGCLLFRCATVYHLFNAINIKLQLYPYRKAGIILSNDTRWGDIANNLIKSNIFDAVLVSDTVKDSGAYYEIDKLERYNSVKDATGAYIKYGGDIKEIDFVNALAPITDVFFALGYFLEKYLYYHILNETRIAPQVHFFEEGTASYVIDYYIGSTRDCLDHKYYSTKNFPNNICELLVYAPQMVATQKPPFSINKIPSIDGNDLKLKSIMESIFGKFELPKERFIYFDSPDVIEKYTSNGIDALDKFAAIVGKENVVVKLHPRNRVNRYALRGYKTIGENSTLWEMGYFDKEVKNKIFISEISTAAMTAQTIFGLYIPSINIFNLLFRKDKNFLLSKANFEEFYVKYVDEINKGGNIVYTPKTEVELMEMAMFLGNRREYAE